MCIQRHSFRFLCFSEKQQPHMSCSSSRNRRGQCWMEEKNIWGKQQPNVEDIFVVLLSIEFLGNKFAMSHQP